MNTDQFSFFNQQLAEALRAGVPLEGALRQLARTLSRGRLRSEIEKLEADLAAGLPLDQALSARRLPALYVQLLRVGARSTDLPGFLTLLADYYRQAAEVGGRLRSLLLYPVLVLLCSLALSCWFAIVFRQVPAALAGVGGVGSAWLDVPVRAYLAVWAPPVFLSALTVLVAGVLALPAGREWLRWRLPAFREASLARLARTLELLVRGGVPLPEALELMQRIERPGPLRPELARWGERLAAGHGGFEDMTTGSRLLPPVFTWLVSSAGEDLATGLARAAEAYGRRSELKTELLLQAVLPSTLLLLGLMLLCQIQPFTHSIYSLLGDLGSMFSLGRL